MDINEMGVHHDYLDEDDVRSDQSDLSASATETSSLVTVKAGCCNFNPVSESGKKWHQVQMIMLPFIPIAALIVQNCWFMSTVAEHQREIQFLTSQVHSTVDLGMLLTALQLERGDVAYYIFSNGTKHRMNGTTQKDQLPGDQTMQAKDGPASDDYTPSRSTTPKIRSDEYSSSSV
ncbi:hypothetical protein OTU49_003891 [Cherax quadricarinatus]|uniref:Uncharacterized protein n=1 Tax=Cherax quadricarinatus TaxID=27406 RepID=A0AAW0XFM6_CHEQU